jgi:hypothetical protein
MVRLNASQRWRPDRSSRTIGVICLVGVALVAGCSSKSKTASPTTGGASSSVTPSNGSTVDAKVLQQQIKAAMTAASAFHLVGSGTDDNGKPLKLDIHFGTDKAAGSVIRAGQKIELINPGGASVYFRLPDALWRQFGGSSAVALLSGKWVKVPANDKRFAELANGFDKDSFIAGMTSGGSSSATLRKVGTEDVNGQPAVKYKSSKGGEIYVAAAGPPVILKTVDPSSAGGTLTFSDYGEHYAFAAPPAGQTVDYTKLAGG